MQQLREAELLTDVTLVCDDESVAAHAVVLATASPLLARLLCTAAPARPALLFLRGASQTQISSLLQVITFLIMCIIFFAVCNELHSNIFYHSFATPGSARWSWRSWSCSCSSLRT